MKATLSVPIMLPIWKRRFVKRLKPFYDCKLQHTQTDEKQIMTNHNNHSESVSFSGQFENLSSSVPFGIYFGNSCYLFSVWPVCVCIFAGAKVVWAKIGFVVFSRCQHFTTYIISCLLLLSLSFFHPLCLAFYLPVTHVNTQAEHLEISRVSAGQKNLWICWEWKSHDGIFWCGGCQMESCLFYCYYFSPSCLRAFVLVLVCVYAHIWVIAVKSRTNDCTLHTYDDTL